MMWNVVCIQQDFVIVSFPESSFIQLQYKPSTPKRQVGLPKRTPQCVSTWTWASLVIWAAIVIKESGFTKVPLQLRNLRCHNGLLKQSDPWCCRCVGTLWSTLTCRPFSWHGWWLVLLLSSAKERRSRLRFMRQWSQVGHSRGVTFSVEELEKWGQSLNALLASTGKLGQSAVQEILWPVVIQYNSWCFYRFTVEWVQAILLFF